jgi:tetratricopeptide (TPR) repeat protein
LVLDWGLAKRLGEEAAGEDGGEAPSPGPSSEAVTVTGEVLGTPQYMSPEQARGEPAGPASDLFSLGLVLYAILTGRSAFEESSFRRGDRLEGVRAAAIVPPRRRDADLPRGLEAICLKALAARPADRYASARALAEDVARWLADEPVTAWREPALVRVQRWMRRHRTTAAAVVMAGVIGLGTVAAVQARANVRLNRSNEATKRALTQSEESRQQSEELRRQAEAVSSFLVAAFRSPDPSKEGRQVKVADVLDGASARLDRGFDGSQATKGALLDALGNTYLGLGLYDQSVSLHTKARAVREAALGADHPDTLKSRINLAVAYLSAGRTDAAIALFEEALRRMESALGPDHPDTLKSRNNLAVAYLNAGRTDAAIALHEATLELLEAKLGPDHRSTLQSRNNLASAYYEAGRLSAAIALDEGTFRRMESALGPDHPDTLASRNNLALSYLNAGRLSAAIGLFERALGLYESKLGADHPDTLMSRVNLAGAYKSLGRSAEAEGLYREVLDRRRKAVQPDSPLLAEDLSALGAHLLSQSRWSEAKTFLHECLAIRAKATPDDWSRYDAMSLLGGALTGQGRYAEAESLVVAAYEGMKAREASIAMPERACLREAAERVVHLYESWGRPDQADAWKDKVGMPDLPADVFAQP